MKLPRYISIVGRMLIAIYGLVFAILMPVLYGIETSYSMYKLHNPVLLGISLAILGFGLYLHKNNKWVMPSIALISVAMFDMDYPYIHNISAITFFLSSTWVLFLDEKASKLSYCSLGIYVTLLIPGYGLFWFELLQAAILTFYHIAYASRMLNIKAVRSKQD